MTNLPSGYRQGFIPAITVLLTASLLYFRFVVFEPASGDAAELVKARVDVITTAGTIDAIRAVPRSNHARRQISSLMPAAVIDADTSRRSLRRGAELADLGLVSTHRWK